jgi:hypothetical protein
MTDEQTRVANLIREAFEGVVLGNGVGLFQAKSMDDNWDDGKKERKKDEKLDWASIPVDNLNKCYSNLTFSDAEGMRFHLPAFILADLEGTYIHDRTSILCNLCSDRDDRLTRFDLLNPLQRRAIQEYLLVCRDGDFSLCDDMIDRALEGYWTLDTIE